ncbi:MAG: hypothetical protein J6R91_06200 [Bacteroidaceae bacterium]|nr:hypothetical protein [Bacteroidaceae bacterium]
MRKYIRKADRIDPERGDILQLTRKSVAPLYANGYPQEMRRNIFDSLLGWFVGGEEPSISDPLANSYLQFLIAAQKEEVQKYLDICHANRENVMNKGATRGNDRSLGVTSVGNINKEEEKDNVNKSFSSSVCEEEGSLSAPLSSHDSVLLRDAALQEIGKIAPPIDNHYYSQEDLEFYEENHADDDDTSVIDELVKDFERSGATNTRKPLEQYLADVGDEMFRRAWFRFDTDVYKAQRAEKPFDNPAGVFLGRLKRLKTALQSLHQ